MDNLKYLSANVNSSKIRLRVSIIEVLHNGNEYKFSYDQLKNMGFENIEVFRYVLPEKMKDISQVAIENKNSFLNKVGKYSKSGYNNSD